MVKCRRAVGEYGVGGGGRGTGTGSGVLWRLTEGAATAADKRHQADDDDDEATHGDGDRRRDA